MEETTESLEKKIKYANKRLEKLKQILTDFENSNQDKNSIYYKADYAMHKSDIANLNAEIALMENKLRNMQQPQPQ